RGSTVDPSRWRPLARVRLPGPRFGPAFWAPPEGAFPPAALKAVAEGRKFATKERHPSAEKGIRALNSTVGSYFMPMKHPLLITSALALLTASTALGE